MAVKMILESTDYGKFKMLECNRDIDQSNVEIIKNSLKVKNKLDVNLLIVTPDHHIIDGQHRFMAAMELGLPVHYLIDDDWSESDMILLNTNRSNWSQLDYIRFYCKKNNVEYLYLQNLIKEAAPYTKNLTAVTAALRILGNLNLNKHFITSLKNGQFACKNKQLVLEFIRGSFPQIRDINELIYNNSGRKISPCLFFTPSYLSAIAQCYREMTETQYKELWACLDRDWIKFPSTNNMEQVKNLFEESYNKHKRASKFDFGILTNRSKK